jgi:hypothetical protein
VSSTGAEDCREKKQNKKQSHLISPHSAIQNTKHVMWLMWFGYGTLKSFPKFENSGIEERSLSYASTVDGGPDGGAPRPAGFLPGAFFSTSG